MPSGVSLKVTVSIIVLTLNSEAYIARCLNSLARQTFRNFEVLVVDAGSTDGTRRVFDRFDARFRWLELPRSDMGAARNFGVSRSSGKYLMFLDSDDMYLPDKLAHQVSLMEENPDVEVSYCAAWHFRTGTVDHVGVKRADSAPRALADFMAGRNHNLSTMCIRRTAWQRGFMFGEGDRGRYGEEWRLQLVMARHNVRMAVTHDPLTVVELRPDSHTTWSLQWKMKEQAIAEVQRFAAQITPEEAAALDLNGIIDQFRVKLIVALLMDARPVQARDAVADIVAPVQRKTIRLLLLAAAFVPSPLLAFALRHLWLWRQNRTFEWKRTPADVFAVLA